MLEAPDTFLDSCLGPQILSPAQFKHIIIEKVTLGKVIQKFKWELLFASILLWSVASPQASLRNVVTGKSTQHFLACVKTLAELACVPCREKTAFISSS